MLATALFVAVGVTNAGVAPAAAPILSATKLRIAIPGSENNVTPFTISFGATPNTHDFLNLVYDSLFWSQVRPDPEPWLAESATPNADFTSWTVKLSENLKWHDGQPLTAEDVKFSFDYYLINKSSAGRYSHHVWDAPPYKSGEVLDPLTVRLDFAQPAPQFMVIPGADLPIIPKHIWETVADPKTYAELPIGSGPYKVTEIQPDQSYRLEANADYMKGKPTVDELELLVIKDPAASFAALETGEVDMVARNVPPELRDKYAGGGDVTMVEGSKFETTQIFFNSRKAPLDNPKVRKAIALAADLDALVDTVLLGQGTGGHDAFIHPNSPWALPGADHEYDPARAGTMLDDAGFALGSDGVRASADGKRLEFTILVNSFEPADARAAQLLAEQVKPVGVILNIEPLDPATLRTRRAATLDAVPEYDAYISTLEAHAHVDPDGLYYFFHSPGAKGFGLSVSGFTNGNFDAIVEGATTAELDSRATQLNGAEEILADEVPGLVLWYRTGEYAVRPGSYSGWVSDPGHGIFTKRSFLKEYVAAAASPPVTTAAPAVTEAPVATQAAASTDTGVATAEASVPETAAPATAAAATDSGNGSGATPWIVAAVVIAAIAAGVLLVRRRRATSSADDDD